MRRHPNVASTMARVQQAGVHGSLESAVLVGSRHAHQRWLISERILLPLHGLLVEVQRDPPDVHGEKQQDRPHLLRGFYVLHVFVPSVHHQHCLTGP